MNWYGEQRMAWIKEMLRIYGYINRHHICEKFGCSAQQAGYDLTKFQAENAKWVQYEPRRRSYINTKYAHARLTALRDDASRPPAHPRTCKVDAPQPPKPSLRP